jgi:hypothetical protein
MKPRRGLTGGSTRTPILAMASPFYWPVLVPCALRAPAPVNLGVRRHKRKGWQMEFYSTSESEHGLQIDGIPDGSKVIAINGYKAHRLSDLALHQQDLRFSLEALDTLNQAPNDSPFIQEALWRTAIIHFIKCFGEGARFQLSAPKIYKGKPPEAIEAFTYFKALRNKHVAHDESAYAQSVPGAVLNDGSKPYRVEKIVCFSARAATLVQGNFANLRLLVSDALSWVNAEFDKLCNELTTELEALSDDELATKGPLQYRVPTVDEAFTKRAGHVK